MSEITHYRLDPELSRFTVQVFATGLLGFVGHSPTFAIRKFDGTVSFPDDLVANLTLELRVHAGSLAVAGEMKDTDRSEIEERMRDDVLGTSRYPDITFQAAAAAAERTGNGVYRLGLEGTLSLRGRSHPYRTLVDLTLLANGLRVKGETHLRMSEFGIPPVTALGGAIRLKDEAVLAFDLGARSEGS